MTRFKAIVQKLTSWTLVAALTLQPVLAQAQTIVVQGADNGLRPRVDTSLSGHPVLNISTPNSAGVSHDIYTEFRTGDTIVNNAATNVNTQLGGFIEGNPNLRPGAEARTWIGEVVGGSQTQLTGILEVAGPSLDMVLANEFGITCDGCGFYNTSRTTLTTGKPVFNADGSLKGFDVKRGLVRVGAGGLNPQDRLALGDTSRVDVIARAAQLYGQMRATETNIIAGANVVDYNWSYNPETGLASGITPQAGTGAVPALAVDVSALGGMYANAIKLIATEAGVGVRINGEMASSSSIALSSSGRLSLGAPAAGRTPAVKAKRQVRVRAAGPILLEGSMSSEQGDLVEVLSWGDSLSVTGEVSGGAVTLQSAGLANINAAVTATRALRIASATDAVVIGAAADLLSGALDIDAATGLTLTGVAASAGVADLTAGETLRIESSGQLGALSAALTAERIEINGLASVTSALDITAGRGGADISGTVLARASAILSNADVRISGAVAGVSTLDITAADLITSTTAAQLLGGATRLEGGGISLAGLLTSRADLTLAAGADGFISSAEIRAAGLTLTGSGDAQLSGVAEIAGAAMLTTAGALSTDAGSGFYADTITAHASSANLAGEMIADATTTITTGADAVVSGNVLGTWTLLSVGGDAKISGFLAGSDQLMVTAIGDLNASNSGILFGADLDATASTITNAGAILGTDIDITSTSGTLAQSGTLIGERVALTSAGALEHSGRSVGISSVTASAVTTLVTNATSEIAGGTLALSGRALQTAGLISADNALTLTSLNGTIDTSAGLSGKTVTLSSAADLIHDGSLSATNEARVSASGAVTTGAASGIKAADVALVGTVINNAGIIVSDAAAILTATTGSVQNSGTVSAGTELTLNSTRALGNSGLLLAATLALSTTDALTFGATSQIVANDLSITAASLTNAGLISGRDDLDVTTTSGALDNSGTLLGADISLSAATDVTHTGVIQSTGAMVATAMGDIVAAAGAEIIGQTVDLVGANVGNSGLINGVNATLRASSGTVSNAGLIYLSGLAHLQGVTTLVSGTARANDIRLDGSTITTGSASILEADRDILLIAANGFTHDGRATALGTLDTRITAGSATVNGALHGDITKLNTSGTLTLGGAAQIIGQTSIETSASLLSGGLDVSDFAKFLTNGDLALSFATGGLTLGPSEQIAHSGNLALALGGDITNRGTIKTSGHLELWAGGDLLNDEGKLLSGGAMVLNAQEGTLTNRSGSIEASGGMLISARDFVNEYRALTVTETTADVLSVTYDDLYRNECVEEYMASDGLECARYADVVVEASHTVEFADVTAADLPPQDCSDRFNAEFPTLNLGIFPCGQVQRDIIGTELRTRNGSLTWGGGTSVSTEGPRPELLVTGNFSIAAQTISNNAGLVAATGDASLIASLALTNGGYEDTASGGTALFRAERSDMWINDGNVQFINNRFSLSNLVSTTGSGTRLEGEIVAGGTLAISGGTVVQNGVVAAGSSATVAPRNSTSVSATLMPALALATAAPTLSPVPVPAVSGSVAGVEADKASKATLATPTASQSLFASASGNAIVLPVIARPASFNTEAVNTLITQGQTRLGTARTSQSEFLTSNYLMDVDRLQYRDELLFNRNDGLPFRPGHFGQSDQALLDQSYEAAIASGSGANVRAPATALFGPDRFGLTRDGGIVLAALTQEAGDGALRITGNSIFSAGGTFTAAGAVDLSADLSLLFGSAKIDGASVLLNAKNGDLILAASRLTATGDVTLKAANDLEIAAISTRFEEVTGPRSNRTHRDGYRVTGSSITAGGDFSAIARNDLTITASKVDASGAVALTAENDVKLDTAFQTFNSERKGQNSGEIRSAAQSIVTELSAGTGLSISAGKNAALTGTKLRAGEQVKLEAKNNITLLAAVNQEFESSNSKSGNFLKKTEKRDTRKATTYQGVAITSGSDASIVAKNNLTTAGTTLNADGNATLQATTGTLLAGTYTDTVETNRFRNNSILGGLLGGTSDTTLSDTTETATDALASLDLKTISGGDTELVGTKLQAGGGLSVKTGGNLSVEAAVSNHKKDRKATNNGLVVTTNTTERIDRDTAAYASFKNGSGLTFEVGGETRIALYSPTDEPRPDAASLLPAELLAIDGRKLLDRPLTDEYFFEEKKKLSPAFKALVSIVVTQGIGALGGGFGLAEGVLKIKQAWLISAVDKFAATLVIESLDAAVAGEFDLGEILGTAAFAGVTAGVTSGINLDTLGIDLGQGAQNSILNFGTGFGIETGLTWQNLAERTLDNILRSGLSSGVYGTDFGESFKAGFKADLVSLATADFQDWVGDQNLGEGSFGHAALHGLVGCGSAALLGGSCAAGAAGGIAQSLYAGSLGGHSQFTDAQKAQYANNAQLIGASAGLFLSEGKAENVGLAGSTARSGFENNYLNHEQVDGMLDELEDCAAGTHRDPNCSIAEIKARYAGLSKSQDEALENCSNRSKCKALLDEREKGIERYREKVLDFQAFGQTNEFIPTVLGEDAAFIQGYKTSIKPVPEGTSEEAIKERLRQEHCVGVSAQTCARIVDDVYVNEEVLTALQNMTEEVLLGVYKNVEACRANHAAACAQLSVDLATAGVKDLAEANIKGIAIRYGEDIRKFVQSERGTLKLPWNATNKGPRAPRVDVSDDLVPTRNPNVDAQYRYGDPDSGHGIEVTVDNGALSLDVAARGNDGTLGSGTDMFNSAMLRLQRDGVEIDRIQGVWIPGTGSDNFAQFNSNIAAGMTRSEAAQNTWTGKIAASHGFTEVVETTRPGSNVIDFDFVRP